MGLISLKPSILLSLLRNNQDLEGGIDMKQHFPDEAGFNDGTQVIPDSIQVEFGKNIS